MFPLVPVVFLWFPWLWTLLVFSGSLPKMVTAEGAVTGLAIRYLDDTADRSYLRHVLPLVWWPAYPIPLVLWSAGFSSLTVKIPGPIAALTVCIVRPRLMAFSGAWAAVLW